jgi:hypothetical protein
MSGLLVELRDFIEDREARADGTLAIVVVGLRIPEERHHAVAQIFCDVAVEARNRSRSGAMIASHRLAPLLGVELTGDRGRAHQVAEQHRQMPPLSYHLSRLNR